RGNGCRLLCQAIRKYGIEEFSVSVLAEVNTLEQLNALEELLIKERGTLSPFGYNLIPGGLNHTVLPETRARLSAIRKEAMRDPKLRARISAAMKIIMSSPEARERTAAIHR